MRPIIYWRVATSLNPESHPRGDSSDLRVCELVNKQTSSQRPQWLEVTRQVPDLFSLGGSAVLAPPIPAYAGTIIPPGLWPKISW